MGEITYCEMRLELKAPPPRITTVVYGGRRDRIWPSLHDVLRVEHKKSGMAWYIDLTFEQFGLERTFWPVMDFYEKYLKASTILPDGSNRKLHDDAKDWGPLKKEAENRQNAAINEWVRINGKKLEEIVELPEEDFRRYESSLLRAMNQEVNRFVRETNDKNTVPPGPGSPFKF